MSLREVPTSLDDFNYQDHFAGNQLESVRPHESITAFYRFVANEPLWSGYTSLLGTIVTPANAIRLTIGLSIALIAFAALTSGRPILFLLLYAATPQLLFTMNYTQLRQGFALAVFMFLLSVTRSARKSAFVACLLHSSFLLMLLAALATEAKTTKRSLAIIAIGVLAAYLLLSGFGAEWLLGSRRDFYLDWQNTLTINFFLGAGLTAFAFLVLAWIYSRSEGKDSTRTRLIYLSIGNTIGALLMLILAPVAGRFLINSAAIQAYVLSSRPPGKARDSTKLAEGLVIVGVGSFQLYQLLRAWEGGLDFFVSFRSLL